MLNQFVDVLEVRSPDALQRKVVQFARWAGFDYVSATAIQDRAFEDTIFSNVDNTPDGYRPYADDRQLACRDPVAQHCKRSSIPIVWDRKTYEATGAEDKWELQAAFGYRSGLAVAFHFPRGFHFYIGVDRDGPLPVCSAERSRLTCALQLFASYAQESALRLLLPSQTGKAQPPRLSRRELESLRWTMEGKTAWEVGGILGISEQTAARHLHHAARKLECANKHHAVVKALRLGLIQ